VTDFQEKESIPSPLSRESLEVFDGMWSYAELVCGADLDKASTARQKKARKKLTAVFSESLEELPKESRAYLADAASDTEFFTRLNAAHREAVNRAEEELHRTAEAVAALTPEWDAEIQQQITALLCAGEWPYDTFWKNGEFLYPVESDFIHDVYLVFSKVKGLPKNAEGCPLKDLVLQKRNGRYRIKGTRSNTEGKDVPFGFSFSDVRIEKALFAADWNVLSVTPWDRLISQSAAICAKKHMSLPYNEKEQSLFPLLVELASLDPNSSLEDELRVSDFPLLATYLEAHAYRKPKKQLEALSEKEPPSHAFAVRAQALRAMLNQKEYAPLWEELCQRIAQSQEPYVSTSEFYLSADQLLPIRERIERRMHAHGYTGSYPHFSKEGSIKGLHIRESYGISYLITRTKKAFFYVSCHESAGLDCGTFSFLSGTVLPRKGETLHGVSDFLFKTNGKSFFTTSECQLFFGNAEDALESDDLDTAVDIAVKKAEMRKLSREEKRQNHISPLSHSVFLFLFCFLFMGVFFGFFMTLGFMLLEFLTALFTGNVHSFPELFTSTPWWLIGLLSGGMFGIAMAIIEVIADRKK